MNNLLNFFIKHVSWFVFMFYVITSCVLLFRNNPYQQSVYLTSANSVASTVLEGYSAVTSYFNLKNINDGYGHSNGNCYIFGACHIICSIFRHSPVFRIGGDEFVVILRDSDYENRHELIEQARQKFYETESDNSRDPWERFSAAVGIAEYHSGDTVDMVFKNADKDMYENKMSMKNKN